jgi:hypothetical protein
VDSVYLFAPSAWIAMIGVVMPGDGRLAGCHPTSCEPTITSTVAGVQWLVAT